MAEISLHYFRLFLNRPFWPVFPVEQRLGLHIFYAIRWRVRGFCRSWVQGIRPKSMAGGRRDGIHQCEMPPVHAQVRHAAAGLAGVHLCCGECATPSSRGQHDRAVSPS